MPCLFISYDAADRDPYLARFLDDLRRRVLEILPKAEFFEDRETLSGSTWAGRVYEAAATSAALLSIYSPRYFNNAACGRVFTIFRWRLKLARERSRRQSDPAI